MKHLADTPTAELIERFTAAAEHGEAEWGEYEGYRTLNVNHGAEQIVWGEDAMTLYSDGDGGLSECLDCPMTVWRSARSQPVEQFRFNSYPPEVYHAIRAALLARGLVTGE